MCELSKMGHVENRLTVKCGRHRKFIPVKCIPLNSWSMIEVQSLSSLIHMLFNDKISFIDSINQSNHQTLLGRGVSFYHYFRHANRFGRQTQVIPFKSNFIPPIFTALTFLRTYAHHDWKLPSCQIWKASKVHTTRSGVSSFITFQFM